SCDPIGPDMNAASGVETMTISPLGVFTAWRCDPGNFVMLSISMSIGPCGPRIDIVPASRIDCTPAMAALPPTKDSILLASAIPSGVLPSGFADEAAAGAGAPPGSGMVISIGVTLP